MALLNEDKANVLFKHYLGTGSSRLSREFFEEAIKSSFIVKPDQLWKYSDMIPDGTDHSGGQEAIEKIKQLHGNGEESIFTWYKSESETKYPIVKKWTQLKLSAIDMGTDNSFQIVDPETREPIKNIIPFNYGSGENEELYNYHLYLPDASMEIPFGVGDWVVDTYSGILTFYDKVPEGIDHNNPPLLTFFQYVGGNGFRQDIHGFEAVILPLDNIEIPDKACAVNDGIYKKIVDVCEKIEEGFTTTYGFDGYDKGEGVALSFEKIIPLLYGDTHDAVKGYESSADQIIRTLLSSKIANNEIVNFVSQKTALGEYTVAFEEKESELIAKVGNVETIIRAGKTDEDKWKVFLDEEHTSFIILSPTNESSITFTVSDGLEAEVPVITMALLYWDASAKDYLPFVNREEKLYSAGVPVVALQGKIPPSLMLDMDSLNSYQDVITPEYYGPRTVEWVIAHEGGRDIKSADFIVKESKVGFSLADAIAAGEVDEGKILLREGIYNLSPDFTLNGSVIYEAESIAKLRGNITLSPGKDKLLVINGIEILGDITVKGEGTLLLNNVKAKNIEISENVKVEIRNCNFKDINISSSNDDLFLLKDSIFDNIISSRDNLLIESCSFDSFTKTGEDAIKPIVLDSNIIQNLNNKTSEIYTYSNYIGNWNVPHTEQTPLPQNEDGILGTTGRLPIYDKGDDKHQLYTEIARPFNYYREGTERDASWPEQSKINVIELLYNPERIKIDDTGRLDVTLDSDDIVMPDDTNFPRGENAWDYDISKKLKDKQYSSKDQLTKVLKDLWHDKADLNDAGKVPLQQLPDEVSYGGMLYIGNWCFDDHKGLYPTKEDIEKTFIIDPDPEAPNCQPGWFFIIEPPEKEKPENENDENNENPVKPQEAVDHKIYTAGDWLVVATRDPEQLKTDGTGWKKIDRAYSEPIYSILTSQTERPGEIDTEWWWRDDGEKGGALPLGNKTIVQAFDDINMQLRKLEPKKPTRLDELTLKIVDEDKLPTFNWIDFNTKEEHTSLDFNKIESITYETGSVNSDKMINNYFYFGDEGEVSSKITGDEVFLPTTKVTRDSEEQTIGTTVISKATDPFEDADHGENFWKGVKITTTIPKEKMVEGENTLQVAVDNCMLVEGKDTTQHTGYAGAINTSYELVEPYFNYTDNTIGNISYNATTFESLMQEGACSGNFAMDLNSNKADKIAVHFTLNKLFENCKIPSNHIGKVWATCRGLPFTDTVDIMADTNASFEADNSTLRISNIILPISKDWNRDLILRRDNPEDNITIYLEIYDFYGNAYQSTLLDINNFEVDKCSEKGRLTHGLFNSNSQIAEGDDTAMTGFGNNWSGIFDLNAGQHNSLQRYGRMIDDRYVEEYRWPSGIAKVKTDSIVVERNYNNYEGETVEFDDGTSGQYAGVCFNFGPVNEISGFTFEIEVEDDMRDKFIYDSLTAKTENVILECCVKENSPLPSNWLDCNSPNNGFEKPKTYKDPAMYAGHSSALIKRVTFGRQCLSGDLYIRMAIKKDTGMQFKGIKLIEVI